MTLKNNESNPIDVIEIIKNETKIVSFMLFFVTFLFTVNFETKGVFAKPLLLFLASALFILYGMVIRISSMLIKKHSQFSEAFNKISIGFYIFSIILFVFSCELLLVGIQGLKDLPGIYHELQIIIMVIAVIPLFFLIFSLLYNFKKQ
jgi:hypothetical protein